MTEPLKFAVIGAGKVGMALAHLLKEQGYLPVGVASKSVTSAQRLGELVDAPWSTKPEQVVEEAEIILITTSDAAIEPVAKHLASAAAIRPGQVVLHVSGAHNTAVLAPVKALGAAVGSMHPLQSFAAVEAAIANLPGSVFTIEGELPAVEVAKRMAHRLGGKPRVIASENKALYHAAACVASNYLVTLFQVAVNLLVQSGLEAAEAAQALIPLMQGTLQNLNQVGLPQALTGPIARGDANTIEKHLQALVNSSQEQTSIYRLLGQNTVPIALAKGSLNQEDATKIEELLRRESNEK